jgi:hypothetical protein
LAEKLDLGELTLKTKWRDFVKAVKEKEDQRYSNMFTTTGYGENGNTSYFSFFPSSAPLSPIFPFDMRGAREEGAMS